MAENEFVRSVMFIIATKRKQQINITMTQNLQKCNQGGDVFL